MNQGSKGRSLLRLTVAGAVVVGASAAVVGTASAAPDDAWDALAACESGGNWSTDTGNGYSGGLQFAASTWRAYGGSGSPSSASRSEQIAVAERVLAAQGWGAWPSCSKKAGVRGHSSDTTKKADSSKQKADTSKRVKASAKPTGAGGYTVASGDTLSKIAAAHGTSVGSLAALNGLANPNALSVGQQLRTS